MKKDNLNTLKRVFLITLFFISNFSFAQTKALFKSIDIGFDYSKLVTLIIPQEKKYEGIAALNFGFGLSIDGEYGYTKKSPEGLYKNGTYTFEGTYYKIGLGYNYPITETAIIGIGARFAQSKFEDYSEFRIKSVIFNDYFETTGKRTDLSGRWLELVFKSESEVKKVKNLKVGLFIRVKFLNPDTQYLSQTPGDFPVQAVPGYGITKGDKSAAINLFVKYSIPLSK